MLYAHSSIINNVAFRFQIIDLKRELLLRGLKVTGNKTVLVERLQSAVMMSLRDAKRKKLDQYDDDCSTAVNNASAEDTLGILEMPVEIIEYIFDYLETVELSAISKTCKWMQQVARCWYRKTYLGYLSELSKTREKVSVNNFRLGYNTCFLNVDHFIPLIDKIIIVPYRNTKEEILYKFIDQQSEFQQLRQLTVRELDFTKFNIDTMQEVLSQLEYMEIDRCKVNDEFLENLFKLAPNIKRLYLNYIVTENRWLAHNYPTLEHCEIISETFVPITVLLTHNPNIRKFGTNLTSLWENLQLIKADEINLEELAIIVDDTDHRNNLHLGSIWQSIDKHSHQGFYKRLHLYYRRFIPRFNQKVVDGIVISTAVDRFCVAGRCLRLERVALSELNFLTNVVHFVFSDSRFIIDIETVATKCECLKRIHFGKSNLSHVKMFIGGNLKLQQIRIEWFMNDFGIREKMKVLNLIELNKERAKLSNAKKITLFVQEPVYLATKRAMRETELEFIKLKRSVTLKESQLDFNFEINF